MDNSIVCNLCGAEVQNILIKKNGFDVYVCTECTLAFTYPQPEAIAEQYDSGYFDLYRKRRDFRIKRGDGRLKKIELIKEPGKLLDIGCSLGYFIEAANARGWDASGIEISAHASEEARKIGLDVKTGILEDANYPSESFNCVTMWDVLEHVPDPVGHMREVNRILAKDGIVVIGTPNIAHLRFKMAKENWRHLKPGEHIYYFQKNSIRRLFDITDFELISPAFFGTRKFAGSYTTVMKSAVNDFIQPNDVLVAYGKKK